jgi:SAM-dependent methyltransferase
MTLPEGPEAQAESLTDEFSSRKIAYLRDTQYATTANFDARVALHVKYTEATQGWFDWLVDQIAWDEFHDVLEVGCGTGLLWEHVPSSLTHDHDITLIDLSQTMTETAAARATSRGHIVRALTGDVHALPFEEDSFDLVIANHMLYHSPAPARATKEIARVLRPGGTIVAATNGPKHLAELHDIEFAVFGPTDERYDNVRVFGSVSGLPLVQQRFESVEWRSHDDRLLCTNSDDVLAYLTSMKPASDATENQLAQLNSEIRHRIAQGNGVFEVSKESGAFIARKPMKA